MIRLFDRSKHRSAATAPSASLSVLFAGCVAALSGCDLSDSGAVSLQIVKPIDGQTFTSKDDVDGKTPGTQIDVTVAVVGVDADAIVELYRLQSGEPVAPTIATATITDNEAVFGAFTLQAGENELQARIKDSERTSESISVKFEDSCGALSFVEPAGSAEEVRLGPSDDRDDEECGDTFTTRVVASTGLSDGTAVALLVNGKASRTANSKGGVVTFDDVVLGNRGDTANKLALQITGSGCGEVELEADVLVACEGPSCSLGGPTGTDLSSADDKDSATAGLQIDFDVQTDTDGRNVMLLINGDADNARTVEVSRGEASFAAVSLPEGRGVRVKAVCTGANGLTGTDERLFNIDTTACAVAITSPDANEEFRAEQASADVAPSATRDINVTATVGSDCVSFQIAPLEGAGCAGIADVNAEPLTAGQTSIATDLTLETQGDQYVCVQVSDSAGNTSVASVPVSFDKTAAELNFTSPAAALSVNVAGTGGRLADQNTATPACDRAMTVSCSENGATVQILTATDKVLLASTTCTGGVATFAAVPLPTKNDGTTYGIIARSTGANGLVGTSAPRTITADCQPQALSFLALTCGAKVIRSSDDADLATPGIQFDFRVDNNPVPRPNLTLTVNGGSATTSSPDITGSAFFDNVTLTSGAIATLNACGTDSAQNQSCTGDCAVIVGDVPTLSITVPAASALLTRDLSGQGVAYRNNAVPTSSDCDNGTNGLQIAVSATTDAPNGRAARIKLMPDSSPSSTPISTLNTTASGGIVSGCIATADGDNLVVRVEVDDLGPGLFGIDTHTVTIDGNAPATAVTLSGTPPVCRGSAALSFVEVFDSPGIAGSQRRLAGWVRRCSYAPITDEAAWSLGVPALDAPSVADANANPRTYSWSARTRPDTTRYCVVRGYDAAGALTPIGNDLEVTAPALEERVIALQCVNNGTSCIAMAEGAEISTFNGMRAKPVGDVNGDGFEDVLIAGGARPGGISSPGAAALHLGGSTGLSLLPAVTFVSTAANNLGNNFLGLGDINSDGLDDFAIGSSSRFTAYVVLGRSSWTSGPVLVDAAGGCSTDLCIVGNANLSSAMSAGDFDSDGVSDLITTSTGGTKVAIVVRGRSVFTPNAGLGLTPGNCLDVRTSTATALSSCTGPVVPQSFRIHTPDSAFGISWLNSRLYLASRGDEPVAPATPSAKVWMTPGVAYTGADLVQVIGSVSDFAHLTVVHDLGNSAAVRFDRALGSVGDVDGDGRLDLAAGIDTVSGRFYVYPGQPNGAVAFSTGAPATQVAYVFDNNLTGETEGAFGDDVALGYHPVFGLLGDIDNDGFGDILTSSQEEGATTAGSVDIFYGSTDKTLSRVRSNRDYGFNDTTLLNDAQANATYWRRAEYIGDVDGDGNNDIAITEENYTNGGQNGRVLILGECNAP